MHSSRMRTARTLTVGDGEINDLSHSSPPPPPLKYYRMTDACENITFARFATRAVTIL